MKIIVLGTNHDVQEKDYKGTNEFRRILKYIIRVKRTDIVMEEWTSKRGSTVGQRLAEEMKIKWANVGTPSKPEFETDHPLFDPFGDPPFFLDRYGPLEVHIQREQYLVNEINKAMTGMTCGIFIVGLAHLHSMSERLLGCGGEIEAFSWTAPPVTM